jgi:hypothetical protein
MPAEVGVCGKVTRLAARRVPGTMWQASHATGGAIGPPERWMARAADVGRAALEGDAVREARFWSALKAWKPGSR